jgi:hypothetical protein
LLEFFFEASHFCRLQLVLLLSVPYARRQFEGVLPYTGDLRIYAYILRVSAGNSDMLNEESILAYLGRLNRRRERKKKMMGKKKMYKGV